MFLYHQFYLDDEGREKLKPLSAADRASLDKECAAGMKRRKDEDIAAAKKTYDRGLRDDPDKYYKAISTLRYYGQNV